jgi:hypothetical protein
MVSNLKVYGSESITFNDYRSNNYPVVLPNKLQEWANHIQQANNLLVDGSDLAKLQISELSTRVKDLEELIPAMADLLEFLKGAHPEILKAYYDTRAATKKMVT